MEVTIEKNRIKNFYYSNKFTELMNSISAIGKLSAEQMDLARHYLSLLLWGEISPVEFLRSLKKDCTLDEQRYTIVLTLVRQKLLDPLQETFEAIYNPNIISNSINTKTQPVVKIPIQNNISAKPSLNVANISARQSTNTKESLDPLDLFDKAKNDIRTATQEGTTLTQEDNTSIIEPTQNTVAPSLEKNEGPAVKPELNKSPSTTDNNSIKINRAAILGNEDNNDLLILQNNQAIAQFSKVLKQTIPTPEKEDLNLYVSSNELKEEPPKPLNPMVPVEGDGDNNAMGDVAIEEETELPNEIAPNNVNVLAKVDTTIAEPKETTIGENIAQSHLKFSQNDKQVIHEERSYSKLLDAMSQKPKNQPPVVGILRDTFAHPDKYSEPREAPKPKPKKYAVTKDDSLRSSVISSTESSSNAKSNAIMNEDIKNDIINLAQDISQKRQNSNVDTSDTSHKPIVYTKQPLKNDDPFEDINKNNLGDKEKTKNPNIIDLS